jgi:hypothetical protein
LASLVVVVAAAAEGHASGGGGGSGGHVGAEGGVAAAVASRWGRVWHVEHTAFPIAGTSHIFPSAAS